MRPSRAAAIVGLLSVVVALGVGEFLAGVAGNVPSPVDAVGQALIPRFPGPVTSWAIAVFGSANRAVLLGGIVVVALLLGAAAAVMGRTSPGVPVAIFLTAGAFGVLAARDQPGAQFGAVVTTTAIAVGVGVLVLRWGLSRLVPVTVPPATSTSSAPRRPPVHTPAPVARRTVLVGLGGVAAVSAAAGALGRWGVGGGTRVEPAEIALPTPVRSRPEVTSMTDASAGIDGLSPILTPTDRFFRIDTALSVPQVDPEAWRLRITGSVDRELEFTLDELFAAAFEEVDVTIACVSNDVGGDLIGTARWLGTPLADLLDRAGVWEAATQIVGRSVDGFSAGFPTAVAYERRDAVVAVGMNGAPLPARHGFPARLVVPGLYGYVSATKWLDEIHLTTWEDHDGYWIPRGWSKEGPVKTSSRIDVPRRGDRVAAGEVVVAGVAWAPTRGIRDVEVAVDDGGFRAAGLVTPLGDASWVQWHTTVELSAGEHELTVRAIDGEGQTQSAGPQPPAPDGAEGWHRRTLRVQA